MTQKHGDGIYYFLGNISSHILHALPLWREIGGTFVVTSEKAKREVERYGVPVIALDNKPFIWGWPGRRPKRIYHYIVLGKRMKHTYEHLNTHAKVVVFYELFELERPEWLSRPKKIFLTHGNMLKSYMNMYPKRLEIVKSYDYMAALGPHMKSEFIKDGVSPNKLVNIGIARADEAAAINGRVSISESLAKQVGTRPNAIISYLPTFWGASSIYTTGIKILQDIPDDYILIFRPHPQTPKKLLQPYLKIIARKPNIIYAPESTFRDIGLLDIFSASSVIIGDVSSVMLEAILTKKPLVFAYDMPKHRQSEKDYDAIKSLVDASPHIYPEESSSVSQALSRAINSNIDDELWNDTTKNNFFDYDGRATQNIAKFIKSLVED